MMLIFSPPLSPFLCFLLDFHIFDGIFATPAAYWLYAIAADMILMASACGKRRDAAARTSRAA